MYIVWRLFQNSILIAYLSMLRMASKEKDETNVDTQRWH